MRSEQADLIMNDNNQQDVFLAAGDTITIHKDVFSKLVGVTTKGGSGAEDVLASDLTTILGNYANAKNDDTFINDCKVVVSIASVRKKFAEHLKGEED